MIFVLTLDILNKVCRVIPWCVVVILLKIIILPVILASQSGVSLSPDIVKSELHTPAGEQTPQILTDSTSYRVERTEINPSMSKRVEVGAEL